MSGVQAEVSELLAGRDARRCHIWNFGGIDVVSNGLRELCEYARRCRLR
jgi:hypothetical protein